ncbi:MAG: ABC transporter permease [Ardenticatenaceae bacterium]|nr:ABC transporter permease [Ardenticatenaceae bacterium]
MENNQLIVEVDARMVAPDHPVSESEQRVMEIASLKLETRSLWGDVWRQMRRNRFAIAGIIILVILVLMAIAAPWIAPHDPYALDLKAALQPLNSPGHLLGTDDLGRDLLSRLIYGARISLTVGTIVVGIAGSIGVTLGALSGYYGGLVDHIIMRVVDVLYAFPFLVLAIAAVAVLGPSLTNMMLVLGLVSWISYARLVRSSVLSLREADFVMAARSTGATDWRIIWQHILPNTVGIVVVQATFGVAAAILAAAGLSFLGMGAQPPTAEWGAMLNKGREFLRVQPVLSIAPGLMIMITVLAINFVGDALQDAFDPRIRR